MSKDEQFPYKECHTCHAYRNNICLGVRSYPECGHLLQEKFDSINDQLKGIPSKLTGWENPYPPEPPELKIIELLKDIRKNALVLCAATGGILGALITIAIILSR